MNNFKYISLPFIVMFFAFVYNVKSETIIKKSEMVHDIIDSDYVFGLN